ncbi:MAG: LytR C-terminal domain-containing protein, partial [Chloroflexota bacterium]|nr:LytR C-terminal domain-containing protein [Chloroflexota bacterium]
SNSIETDIPIAKQLEMANYLRQANLREIRQLVLDDEYGEGGAFGPEGAWILKPDRARVRAALATFFSPAPQEASSGLAMANPSWVRIEVLNGTDQPGVAARTRDLLTAQGWQVVAIGDADRSDYGRTLIINYGVPQMLVEKVSADLNLQPNLSRLHGLKNSVPIDVRIVVGQDILPKVK